MKSQGPTVVKQLPECPSRQSRKTFLAQIKQLVDDSYRPQLVVDLSSRPACTVGPQTIDLLLKCVEHMQRAEGRVSLAAPSPETSVILELTRLTSVVDVFPSVMAAAGGDLSNRAEPGLRANSDHLAAQLIH